MKVVFLDRDGVINKFPGLGGYVTRVKDFRFLPGSLDAIKFLTEKGFTLFVVSNQAGVSRGLYSESKLNQITKRMLEKIRQKGGKVKKVFYCVHTPDQSCECRKPNIGSIKSALKSLGKSMQAARRTYFIGDAESDILAGQRAGCRTIFVSSGKDKKRDLRRWKIKPDYIAKNLREAAILINKKES